MGMYEYVADWLKVIDGDTIKFNIDMGFYCHLEASVRLLGVSARELSMPGGAEARDNLHQIMLDTNHVLLRTVKPDKYQGRWDAAVTLPDGRDLSTLLIQTGWAVPWSGRGTPAYPAWPIAGQVNG